MIIMNYMKNHAINKSSITNVHILLKSVNFHYKPNFVQNKEDWEK